MVVRKKGVYLLLADGFLGFGCKAGILFRCSLRVNELFHCSCEFEEIRSSFGRF